MTTSTAPRTAAQILSDIVVMAATLVSHPTCSGHLAWNEGVREVIAGLDAKLTEAEARELAQS